MTRLPIQAVSLDEDAYPRQIRAGLGSRAPKVLYWSGNLDILKLPSVGLLASRQANPACLLKAYALLDILAGLEVCVLGGWHSALEMEMLSRICRGDAKIAVLPAKGLADYEPPDRVRDALANGDALVLTHCGPHVARVTREAALRRNRLLVALSGGLFVPCAFDRSATAKLAAEAVAHGTPVATVEHEHHKRLTEAGTAACDADAFRAWVHNAFKSAGESDAPADA